TQNSHHFNTKHLIRSSFVNKPRPILINNWEATYIEFTEEKILQLAQVASRAGIELFVMDDGWFGKRNNDESSLGDRK
ncbi:alpha-galactosidase, partial [Streptococcus suis]